MHRIIRIILPLMLLFATPSHAAIEGNHMATQLIKQYYDAILAQNLTGFLELLSDDVVHDINQGPTEVGKPKFKAFMEDQFSYGDIKIKDLTILTSADGKTGFSRFQCEGIHSKNVEGFPPPKNQHWSIPVVTYFTIKDNKVTEVAVYYNANAILKQVS